MQKKKVKSLCEYLIFIPTLSLFKILPYFLSRKIIVLIFRFAGLLLGIRKRVARSQISEAFPEKKPEEIRLIMSNLYRNLALTSLEMFVRKDLSGIEVEGWENIEKALELKRGLILVSGHIGNWELAGRYIAHQDITLSVVIKRLRNSYFNNYVNRTRNKDGIKIIYKSKTMRPVLKALKNNEIVVMLVDQDAGKDGIVLPFLGKDASVFTGYARLAQIYDTPLIWCAALRIEENKSRFVFEKYILPSSFQEEREPVRKIAEYINNRLESYIRIYPDQWFWVHRRWKGAHKAQKSEI